MSAISTRLVGIGIVIVGLALGWFFLIGPLRAAMNHEPEISYSLRIFFIVPVCVIFGGAYAIAGTDEAFRTSDRKNLTLLGWVLFAIVAVLTLGGYFWLEQQFAALGYS